MGDSLPPIEWAVSCPDCGRTASDGSLDHDETCPLARCWNETRDDDRDWFARTGLSLRLRPPTWCEIADARLVGQVIDPRGVVVIRYIRPGVHVKRLPVAL